MHNLEKITPFNLLTKNQIEAISKNSNIVKFRKGDIVFRQFTRTSHIMFLHSGLLKTYKEGRHNKTIILSFDKAQKFIGSLSPYGEDIYSYSTAAVQDSEILYIDINVFNNVIKENEPFSQYIIKNISEQGLFVFDRLMQLHQKQVPGRVADLLLYFADNIYYSNKFSIPVTRKELADFVGTSKESLIRTLSELNNDLIIKITGKEIEITGRKLLEKLSELG